MAFKPAICTQCGAQIQVDESKEAGICPNCGTAFVTEKIINQYVTNNNYAGATIVQSGVDTENLYVLARRAVSTNNKDDVLKYYGQIRERNPNDWESTFFYAWFEGEAHFIKNFKITENLILQLDPEKQIDALKRMYTFFKSIEFTFEFGLRGVSPFVLKDQTVFYSFVMKLLDERNVEVANWAGYMTNFMKYRTGQKEVYLEILNRNDNFYIPFLKNFISTLYDTPSPYINAKKCQNFIKEVEKNIEKVNSMLNSEEEKKDNFLGYYKGLLKCAPDRLKPENFYYLEKKIKEMEPSYFDSEEVRKNYKKDLSVAKKKRRDKNINIFTQIFAFVLSVFSVGCLYYTSHPVWGTLSLLVLLVLNLSMVCADGIDDKVKRVFYKIVILLISITILILLNN